MTLIAASIVVLASLCPCRVRPTVRLLSSYLSLIVFSAGLVTVLGYLYGSPLLYGGEVRPVSLLTGAVFALLGASLITVRGPTEWPTIIFVGPSVEARLLRVFMPLSVIVILLSGSLSNRALSTSSNPALTASAARARHGDRGRLRHRASVEPHREADRLTAETKLAKAENELRQTNRKLERAQQHHETRRPEPARSHTRKARPGEVPVEGPFHGRSSWRSRSGPQRLSKGCSSSQESIRSLA